MGREDSSNQGGRGGGRSTRRQGKGGTYKGRGQRFGYQNKQELKFYPQGGGRQQQATFEAVKEHILQYIQKTYEQGYEIAKSLREMKEKDFSKERPKRVTSEETDKDKRKEDQEGLDIFYKAEINEHIKRSNLYKDNMKKAYALIMSYTSKIMQNRLETLPNFESEIRDKPIKLLAAIRTKMHDPERTKYPFAALTLALMRLLTLCQYEKENLLEYSKRFKQAADVLQAHLGTEALDGFIETTEHYTGKTDEFKVKRQQKHVVIVMIFKILFISMQHISESCPRKTFKLRQS